MKKILLSSFYLVTILSFVGCKKYFDINADPASPQKPTLSALLPPVYSLIPQGMYLDGRFSGTYAQNYTSTANDNFDFHGGNVGGAIATTMWRTFFAQQGSSINVILEKGEQEQAWDYVGVALALRAWGFQATTDYFGELPFYDAWKIEQTSVTAKYKYDKQEVVYKGIDSLCRKAIEYLRREDGIVNQNLLRRGDLVYQGDRSKWIKFTYGILARLYNRTTNKSTYSADSVFKFTGLAMANNNDNFYVPFTASRNDDTNPAGPARDNFGARRASRFITQLLDGTIFVGNSLTASRDPRISRMLSTSFDTTTVSTTMPTANGGYRFCLLQASGIGDPNAAAVVGTAAFRQRVPLMWGDSVNLNPGSGVFGAKIGKYVFQNAAPFPVMTYHEMQFIRAEALLRIARTGEAWQAYQNGINSHFDFVNFYATQANGVSIITPTQRTAYFATAAVKNISTPLTLTDVMLQKYIGDFGWNFTECWADMRRYHYFDFDPATNDQVYKTLAIPFYSTANQGPKPAYRFAPTNFSEYDWNVGELIKIGGLNIDYHTYEMWFSQP